MKSRMAIEIRQIKLTEVEEVIPVLMLAEESESALWWSLKNLSDTIYRMDEDGKLVGAATLRWNTEPCEILELAIVEERQGQGLGRQLINYLLAEGRRRGKTELLVGTGNSSIENLIFYQRCGFRMYQVRQDYFWYLRKPVYENGIRLRDMLVFRYDLTEEATEKT